MKCPRCGSRNIKELGVDYQDNTVYLCRDCGETFTAVTYCQDVDSGNVYMLTEKGAVRLGAG